MDSGMLESSARRLPVTFRRVEFPGIGETREMGDSLFWGRSATISGSGGASRLPREAQRALSENGKSAAMRYLAERWGGNEIFSWCYSGSGPAGGKPRACRQGTGYRVEFSVSFSHSGLCFIGRHVQPESSAWIRSRSIDFRRIRSCLASRAPRRA